MSRLAVIAVFAGAGGWTVFNSKFNGNEQQAQAKTEDEAGDETSVAADGSDSTAVGEETTQKPANENGSANRPATFEAPATIKPVAGEDNRPQDSSEKPIQKTPPRISASKKPKQGSSSQNPSKTKSPPESKSTFQPGKNSSSKSKSAKQKNRAGKSGSSQGLTSKPSSHFPGTSPSGFNPGKGSSATSQPKSGGFNPTSGLGANSSQGKDSSGPPPSSFSSAFAGKAGGRQATEKDGSGVSATRSADSSKSDSGGFSRPKTGGSPSGFASKNSGTSSRPPSSKAPSTKPPSTKPPSTKPSTSFGGFQPGGSLDNKTGGRPAGNPGGFRSVNSKGNESPLRGRPDSRALAGQAKSRENGSPTAPSDGTFSLSSNSKADDRTPKPNFSPGSSGSDSRPSTKELVSRAKSNPAFQGSGAFQDRGSKKLPPDQKPPASGVNKTVEKSGFASSGSAFGGIQRPSTQPPSNQPPSNQPTGNRSTNDRSSNDRPASKSPPASGSAGFNPTGNSSQPPTSKPFSLAPNGGVAGSSRASAGGNRRDKAIPNNASLSAAAQPSPRGNPNNPVTGVADDQPGPAALEGIQAPAVTLQKVLPPEVQVGVETAFKLIIRNVGRTTATNISVIDYVPQGTEFRNSVPAATRRGTDGSLVWQFGTLEPGQAQTIVMNLVPKQQGSIGSVARLSLQTAATAKTVCTKPEIELIQKGPSQVRRGENVQFLVTVKNTGDGRAMNVAIEDEVPAGFAFANGRGERLAYELGNLAPGQSRNVALNLRAVEAGKFTNRVKVRMGKTLAATKEHRVEVTAPKLEMKVIGPTRRYIEREARYQVQVENTGTASAKNVTMVTRLPKGMKFLGTNNRGQYNPREHAVYWSMVSLTPQNKGTVELRLLPIGTGQQPISFEARSVSDRSNKGDFPILVDQLAELFFEVDDRDDPIEVDGETEYRIRVVNQGSKVATNVRVAVEMPAGIAATDNDGPTRGLVNGKIVTFAPLPNLAPRGEAIFKVRAKGVSDGDHLIKVMLSSDERKEVVAKEESTKVYSEFR